MASPQKIRTPLTDLFRISHPVILAGMSGAGGPVLAAAVTNGGGLGVIGGVNYAPAMLRDQVAELKAHLHDKNAPFGVDLLLPQVGGSARKTNYDYTKGKLDELIGVVIESGACLFVSAVGVPPRSVVERLHHHGILYMNIVGHPKHVAKCLQLGVDIICAQGGEAGGHTGDVPTTVLLPEVVRRVRGHTSPLTGKPVQVVAAGGMHNGQLLAAALMMGASAVWVGTRFILTDEAGAPELHKEAVRTAGFDDTVKTLIFSGRPLRARKTAYIVRWENERQAEMRALLAEGKIPNEVELDRVLAEATDGYGGTDDDATDRFRVLPMGLCAAVVNDQKSAREVIDEFVEDAAACLQNGSLLLAKI